ncbi:MAG: hypothetical protein KGR26_03860 [Cyanobacteria bacterium REEB65]|nr:hypothetical protein [Cyanobacteria bacterium REEB65]
MNVILLGGEITGAVVFAAGAAAVAIPRSRMAIGRKIGPLLGRAYAKQMGLQFKAKFPDLHAKFGSLKLGPESQGALQTAMQRIPPQEALKLQGEFLRSKDWFLSRHTELEPFVSAMAAQDASGQAKALQAIFKLPEAQRKGIETDLLSAYDRLAGRFPKWVNLLEATLKNPVAERTPEPAGKR